MRHILLFLLSLSFSITANANPVKVKRIEPSNWYVGMKDPTLQLMVYGENIRETDAPPIIPVCASTAWHVSTVLTTSSFTLTSREPPQAP